MKTLIAGVIATLAISSTTLAGTTEQAKVLHLSEKLGGCAVVHMAVAFSELNGTETEKMLDPLLDSAKVIVEQAVEDGTATKEAVEKVSKAAFVEGGNDMTGASVDDIRAAAEECIVTLPKLMFEISQ